VQTGDANVLVGVHREAAAAGAGDELVHVNDDNAGQKLRGELLRGRKGALGLGPIEGDDDGLHGNCSSRLTTAVG
jgi:hypothetical protein